MKKSICLGLIVGSLLHLYGCTSTSLQTADGKNTLTDSAPWDSVAAISTGLGCQVPNPYIAPPTPAPAPVVMTQAKVCDIQGGNCQMMALPRAVAADPSTECVTTIAQTKGMGISGWLGGLGGIVASIFALAGSGGI